MSPKGGRYQTLSLSRGHGRLLNRTVFGRALHRACGSTRLLTALPDYGFFDCGCLSLAIALRNLAGHGAKIRYVTRPGYLDHAVCAVRVGEATLYLDADGLADARDLKAKMAWLECHATTVGTLRIVDATRDEARRAGLDDWDEKSVELTRRLRPLFGRHRDVAQWTAAPAMTSASLGPT